MELARLPLEPSGRALAAASFLLLGCTEDVFSDGASVSVETSNSGERPFAAKSKAFSAAGIRSLAIHGEQEPRQGGSIRLVYPTEPSTLSNMLQRSRLENYVCQNYLYPPLLRIDLDTLELVPELAVARPEWSADRRVMTFELRSDLAWVSPDDGSIEHRLTTEDVAHTWRVLHSEGIPVGRFASVLEQLEELQVHDETRFSVRLKEPYFAAEFEFATQFPLLPRHFKFRDADEFQEAAFNRRPSSYGPYRFESWEPGLLTLVRNEHWPGMTTLDRVQFLTVRDSEKLLGLFRSQEADVVALQDAEEFHAAQQDPELQELATFHQYYLPQWNCVAWNLARFPWQDRRVRAAMAYLYPRQIVQERFYRGHAAVVTGPWSVLAPEYDADLPPRPQDSGKAEALLAEAGFADHDRNGILDQDGRDFEFTLLQPATVVPALDQGALLFQQELRRLGILLHFKKLDFSALLERLREHDFDAAQFARTPKPVGDDLYAFLHSSQVESGNNFGAYRNPECDQLLEEFRACLNRGRRVELGHEIHRLAYRDQPYLFLHAPQSLVLISTRFDNVQVHRAGLKVLEWWLAD